MTKRRSSWRRWVVRGAVCVVLGVVTTVGVAWGGALRPSTRFASTTISPTSPLSWRVTPLAHWPATPYTQHLSKSPFASFVVQDKFEQRQFYKLVACEAGWPMRSLRWIYAADHTGNRIFSILETGLPVASNPASLMELRLPLAVLPVGFVVNSAIFSVLAWLLLFGPITVRHANRRRRGACDRCGYDLVHKFDDGCPECGWNRA